MKYSQAIGIVLTRVDYGEADRIITFLTQDSGKITLMVKGCRRVKSKLAGAVEIFSTSELVYVKGKGSMGTLVSGRLIGHPKDITSDISRTMFGYDALKIVHKITEDDTDLRIYSILEQTLTALGDMNFELEQVEVWFGAQLLASSGHMPNLISDTTGDRLTTGRMYDFDFDKVAFMPPAGGQTGAYHTDDIKFLRIIFGGNNLSATKKIAGVEQYVKKTSQLIKTLRQFYLTV